MHSLHFFNLSAKVLSVWRESAPTHRVVSVPTMRPRKVVQSFGLATHDALHLSILARHASPARHPSYGLRRLIVAFVSLDLLPEVVLLLV